MATTVVGAGKRARLLRALDDGGVDAHQLAARGELGVEVLAAGVDLAAVGQADVVRLELGHVLRALRREEDALRTADVLQQHGEHGLARRHVLGEVVRKRPQVLDGVLADLGEEVPLGRIVAVERAGGYLGLLRDIAERGVLVPVLQEQVGSHPVDTLLRLRAADVPFR